MHSMTVENLNSYVGRILAASREIDIWKDAEELVEKVRDIGFDLAVDFFKREMGLGDTLRVIVTDDKDRIYAYRCGNADITNLIIAVLPPNASLLDPKDVGQRVQDIVAPEDEEGSGYLSLTLVEGDQSTKLR